MKSRCLKRQGNSDDRVTVTINWEEAMDTHALPQDTKKVFMKLGTCSRSYCYLLNREFGSLQENEERAADPLAGGIMLQGRQCGMLWGSSLAIGAESHRRHRDRGTAIAAAISATKLVMESYADITGSVDCRDVCGYDLTRKLDMAMFMMKFFLHVDRSCLDLADSWLPDAIRSAEEGLSRTTAYSQEPASCASEAVRRMGADDKTMMMVAGFAGGLGLSGGGCGALAAAIWMKSLAWIKENPGKSAYNNPYAKKTLNAFRRTVGSDMRCHALAGKRFATIDEHTEFMAKGGCAAVLTALAQS